MSNTFDTIVTNPASGGALFATDQYVDGSDTVNMQVTALVFGPQGGPYSIVSSSDPLPVNIKNVGEQTKASSIPVVLASDSTLPLPSGAATESTLGTLAKEGTSLTGTSLPSGSSVLGWLSYIWKTLSDRLPSSLVGGRLDVNVGNLPTGASTLAEQQIQTTHLDRLTQPLVSNGSALPSYVEVVAGYDGSNVRALSTDNTGKLNVIGPLTNTQLRASDVSVSNTGTFAVQASQTGTWTVSLPSGASTLAEQQSQTTLLSSISSNQPSFGSAGVSATDVLSVQGISSMTPLLVDGSGVTQPISASSLPLPSGAATAVKQPSLGSAGVPSTDVLTIQGITSMTPLKVDASAFTQPVSGTVTANIGTSGNLALDSTLTGGTQKTKITNGSTEVSVKNASTPAVDTDPALVVAVSPNNSVAVTVASLPLPVGASTAAKQPSLGSAGTPSSDVITIQGVTSMTPVKTDGSGVTQPISGTITANIGTSGSLALDATLTGGTQKTRLTSGSTDVAVKGASTAALASDPALVVAVSPNNSVAITASSLPLPSGAATSAKQPSLGSAGTASSDVISIQGISGMTAVKVDGSATTQPVSGTVTSNIGTTGGLALDATLTGGTLKAKITDGTNDVDVKGASTAALTTDKALVVAVSPNNSVAVTAASLPLPSGASTAAKQPSIGSAGTPSSDVLTIQGISSMTPLSTNSSQAGTWTVQPGNTANTTPWLTSIHDGTNKASVRSLANNALNVAIVDASGNQVTSFSGGGTQYTEDQASSGGESLTLAGAVRRDTAASSSTSDGDYSTINTDSSGRLWTRVGTIDGGTITNLSQLGGNAIAMGTGTRSSGTQRVTVATDDLVNVSGIYNSTLPSVTNGNTSSLQIDSSARLLTVKKQKTSSSVSWTSSNAVNTTFVVDVDGASQVGIIWANSASTITVSFDVSQDGTTYIAIPGYYDFGTGWALSSAKVMTGNSGLLAPVFGAKYFRLKISSAISGGGSCDISVGASDTGIPLGLNYISNVVSVDTELPAAAALANASSNPTTPLLGACNLLYNGSTWDLQQGKETGTLIASGTRSTNTASGSVTSRTAKGVRLYLSVSAAGAGTIYLIMREYDPLSGNVLTCVNGSAVAVSVTGTYVYEIYPGASTTHPTTGCLRQAMCLPRVWDVAVIHTGAGNFTYSVGYTLMP